MTASELFEEIVGAPDRDRCPGAQVVVSFRTDDDARYLEAVEARATLRARLLRRGVWHGHLAVVGREPDAPEEVLHERWEAARPILLGGAWAEPLAASPDETRHALEALRGLEREGGLRRWIDGHSARLPAGCRVAAGDPPLTDGERDLERVSLDGGPDAANLWIKTGRLSLHSEDASLRLRISFGDEGADDASRDRPHLERVHDLAHALLPACAAIHEERAPRRTIERLAGGPLLTTQHIAYWNAPQGGALFHHDAFDEPDEERQLGVLFVQVVGCTAWLALSSDDLVERVHELCDGLDESDEGWLAETVFAGDLTPERLAELLEDEDALRGELALPGCGELAQLVNLGPEFTGLLADAGHAWILEPGDGILLPNHGLGRTAFHSVFCASPEPTYGLSMALRPAAR